MSVTESEQLVITIGGTAYTSYTTSLGEGFILENALTSRMDTATITLCARNPTQKTTLDAIIPWQEVIVSVTPGGTVRFAGYVVSISLQPVKGTTGIFYVLTCQDYSCLLERTHVNTSYTSQTDAYIINNLMTNYASAFNGTTYVVTGKTIDSITFNRVSIFDALQQISEVTGYEWYVDEDKNIHYFASETYSAPYTLSDSGAADVARYQTFHHENDASQIKNRVFVYGGTYLSDDFSETFIGDASKTIWSLAYTPATLPVITVDAEAQLEGIDNIDDPDNVDVLVNSSEKLIKFTVAPSNTAVIVVTYKYSIPILARVRNTASYTLYGKWFDYKIIDRNISTIAEANEVGQALLADDAFARVSIDVSTLTPGFRAGQMVHIVNSVIGLDDYFLIQRVTGRMSPAKNWMMIYSINVGEYRGNVIDLMRLWKVSHAPTMDVRDDEQLNELLDSSESVDITEVASSSPHNNIYYWTTTFVWELSTWS